MLPPKPDRRQLTNLASVRLVELRGIEPLTSAVRLHKVELFFAFSRRFPAAKHAICAKNLAVCDTLAIRCVPPKSVLKAGDLMSAT